MVRILLRTVAMDATTAPTPLVAPVSVPVPRPGAQQTPPPRGDEDQVLADIHTDADDAEPLLVSDPTPEPTTPAPQMRLGRGQEFEIILNELSGGAPFSDADRLITVDELERRYIERVLTLTAGNKSRAAQILGFDRRTLYRKIERYGRSQ